MRDTSALATAIEHALALNELTSDTPEGLIERTLARPARLMDLQPYYLRPENHLLFIPTTAPTTANR